MGLLSFIYRKKQPTHITKDMYEFAKSVVKNYEMFQNREFVAKKIEEKFNQNNNLNPFKDGEIMPCCGEIYAFSYSRMKYLPKNHKLRYRKNGDIDFDKNSKSSLFVEYNNAREAIRQAKNKNHNHVHWKISSAVAEELEKDGYICTHDELDTIKW